MRMIRHLALALAFLTSPAIAETFEITTLGIDKSGSAPYPLAFFTSGSWDVFARLDANGKLVFPASSSTGPSLTILPGVAPTVPTDGAVWVTTTGFFVHIGGNTVQVGPVTSAEIIAALGYTPYNSSNLNSSAVTTALGYTPANKAGDRFGGAISVGTGAAPNHEIDSGGNIGIPVNGFLNFGATDGSGGYGIRDNAGSVEYKNVGGAWTEFGSGTVFSVTCGQGLIGGEIIDTGTCAVDSSARPVRVRQTVMSGPVDTNGFPTFLPATNSSLAITTQNLSAGFPLCMTAANGYSASPYGEVNYTACTTSNLTWTGLTGSQTLSGVSVSSLIATFTTSGNHNLVSNAVVTVSGCGAPYTFLNGSWSITYGSNNTFTVGNSSFNSNGSASGCSYAVTEFLYATVACAGGTCTLTPGSTLLPAIYQPGGTPSTIAGQFTFYYGSMIGYFGNGATAPQSNIVFLGEVLTGASGVTASTPYSYSGLYVGGWSALPSSGSLVSLNHNLGTASAWARLVMKNVTGEQGYIPNDLAVALSSSGAQQVALRRNTAVFYPSGNFSVLSLTSGGSAGVTTADWNYRLEVRRGW